MEVRTYARGSVTRGSERKDHRPRAGGRKGKAHGSVVVGHLMGLLIERHPSFSTNPVGDWKELVGDQVARYCQPQSLKQKVLFIAAYDSIWKHHLELHKEALVEKINLGRPEPLVEKIVIRVGELPENDQRLTHDHPGSGQSGAGKLREKKKKRKVPNRRLTPDEKSFLKSLQDPDLKVIGARLLKRIPLESD
jgi:hypothetical protein